MTEVVITRDDRIETAIVAALVTRGERARRHDRHHAAGHAARGASSGSGI
jgi:hypothetical protein